MPDGVTTRSPALARAVSGSTACSPISALKRADDELADRDRAALREERPHAQVGIDAAHAGRVDRARRGPRE